MIIYALPVDVYNGKVTKAGVNDEGSLQIIGQGLHFSEMNCG